MRVYTKTGDKGVTSLLSGRRVPKNDIRIIAYGTVDELNAYMGLLKDQDVNEKRVAFLETIQNSLFTIGALLAADTVVAKKSVPQLKLRDIELLEKEIDTMHDTLPPMRSFILPGGHVAISFGHIARTVCRRTERLVIDLAHHAEVSPRIAQYLNRLSDYCFVLCRKMMQELRVETTPYQYGNNPKREGHKKLHIKHNTHH